MPHPYNHSPTFMQIPNTPSAQHGALDIGIMGFCLDLGTTNRPGTRFGPTAIRTASLQLMDGDHPLWEISPSTQLKCWDYGDAYLPTGNYYKSLETIEKNTIELINRVSYPIVLGGDHSLSLPVLAALKTKHPHISLLHFDAHCDIWEPSEDCSINHGTIFRQAIEAGIIRGQDYIQVGIRSPVPKAVTKWGRDQGITTLSAQDVHTKGLTHTIAEIKRVIGDNPVYLTSDIDCLDPSQAPGTGTPEIGGLMTWQILNILSNLTELNWIGFDITEVSPPYDHAELTSLAAATLVWNFMCLIQLKLTQNILQLC